MQFWHEQSNRYHTELKDFKKRTAEAMDGLRNEHSTLFKDLQGAAVRVDRVEREMDYVETRNSPRACSNKADKVLEQGAWGLEESRGEEVEEKEWEELNSRVSGELQGITHMFLLDDGLSSFIFIHDGALPPTEPIICIYMYVYVYREIEGLCIMAKFSSHSRHPSRHTYSHGKSSSLWKQTRCCYKSFNGVLGVSGHSCFPEEPRLRHKSFISAEQLPCSRDRSSAFVSMIFTSQGALLQTMLRYKGHLLWLLRVYSPFKSQYGKL